ncbi:MAG: OmpA family protein [Bacteroidetes bacterium]|nr:OmpA family protein [Bacteroidota bacterium]
MKILILSILVAGTISTSTIAQVAGFNSLHPLSGRWAVSVEGGATYTKADFRNSLFDYYSRVMGEYFFATKNVGIFGVRAFAGLGRLNGSGGVSGYADPNTGLLIDEFKTPIILLGGGLNYAFEVSDKVFPYVYAGASYLYFDPKDVNGDRLPNNSRKKYSRNEVSLQGELGIRFLLSTDLSLNFNGSLYYVNSDELDDVIKGRDNDIFFTFLGGVSFYFGGVKDSDADGVRDEDDVCPETPQGVRVDEFGCPVDTDGDGVPDYLDRCPGTRSNIIVNADGCPLDSDEDGVPDYLDQCPNTPLNVPVDTRGCPFDSDGDGVPDYMDNCPDTPAGTEVNKFGCPLKSQEKELPQITRMTLSGEVNFAVGKANLQPAASNKLNKLVKVLYDNPDTRWRIQGHTDNTGSYTLNKKLSLERAWAVADYLISKGIDALRLEVEGVSSDFPIADNSTNSGRKLNRRVSIKLIDGVAESERVTTASLDDVSYNKAVERNVGNMIFTDGRLYCFQLSSWRSYDSAVREVDRFQAQGENAFIVEIHNLQGLEGTWYRVRIGYFNSLQETRDHRANVIR